MGTKGHQCLHRLLRDTQHAHCRCDPTCRSSSRWSVVAMRWRS